MSSRKEVKPAGGPLPAQRAPLPAPPRRSHSVERVVPARLLPVAAGASFLAGVAASRYTLRRWRRKAALPKGRRLEVVGSRSFLLDIHLLARPRR